ncbi:IS1249 family transposase [Bifidobacterium vansinderenii]|uniref:Transposase n=9 Tax=Bifidobacterium vansinderenii TaxID=1984871 RepID=A0A229VUF9_9BIFI|nr:IS1249 family transposase [Bifidobacterium vansinderenii]OXM99238.1 transposase [Bifidobacterium vansinderenii]
MRTKSSKAKKCPVCGSAMKRNGRTRAGTQRWMCVACSLTGVMRQQDAERGRQLDAFLGWLLGRASQSSCDAHGDARALRKRTAWCWNIRPEIPPCTVKHHTVMADGTYMSHGWCLITAVDGESGEVLGSQWCPHESKAAYVALFSRIPSPDVLVTDGLRGAETACNAVWPSTRIQRCLVHVQRNTRADLTSKPRLEAGRELKKLSDRLTKVHDAEQAAKWGEALNAWHLRWRDFIDERTLAKDDPDNPKASKQEWWWTHQEVRRCYRRLEKLFREGKLFAFLEPSLTAAGPVARTTNRLEGGVNSPLKHVLLDHHGLPEEHMRRACEWVCYMKSGSPDPKSLIRPEHWKPLRRAARPDDSGDDGSPQYGTGVDWNEFHTHTEWNQTD